MLSSSHELEKEGFSAATSAETTLLLVDDGERVELLGVTVLCAKSTKDSACVVGWRWLMRQPVVTGLSG